MCLVVAGVCFCARCALAGTTGKVLRVEWCEQHRDDVGGDWTNYKHEDFGPCENLESRRIDVPRFCLFGGPAAAPSAPSAAIDGTTSTPGPAATSSSSGLVAPSSSRSAAVSSAAPGIASTTSSAPRAAPIVCSAAGPSSSSSAAGSGSGTATAAPKPRTPLPASRPPPDSAAAARAAAAAAIAANNGAWSDVDVAKLLLLRSKNVAWDIICRDHLLGRDVQACKAKLASLTQQHGFNL